MLRTILSYGVIAGLIVGVPMSAMLVARNGQPPLGHGMLVGYSMMLIGLTTIFIAIKRRRDGALGGVIGFWPALGLGLGISAVAGVFYVAIWEFSVAVTHLDFGAVYSRYVIDQAIANGTQGPALAKLTAEMATFRAQYADPLFRLPMTFIEIFPVGVLVSLVSAGLLRNPRFLPARAG